jgi:hypothetical protein
MQYALVVVASAVTLFAAAPAAAQNGNGTPPSTDRALVLEQLDAVVRLKQGEGFTTARAFDQRSTVGLLPQHGIVVLEMQLRAGIEYFVTGGCDADCHDLDLRAYAPGGRELLAQDVETDDVPILSFTARETGPHLLGVVMSGCRTELCYFGVRVLSR